MRDRDFGGSKDCVTYEFMPFAFDKAKKEYESMFIERFPEEAKKISTKFEMTMNTEGQGWLDYFKDGRG